MKPARRLALILSPLIAPALLVAGVVAVLFSTAARAGSVSLCQMCPKFELHHCTVQPDGTCQRDPQGTGVIIICTGTTTPFASLTIPNCRNASASTLNGNLTVTCQ